MYKIEQSSEEINSNGGIVFIGKLLNELKSLKKIDEMSMKNIQKGRTSHSCILKSAATLMALGRNDYADIEYFREDPLFADVLGLSHVPSEETLRQRLDDIATANKSQTMLDDAIVELLSRVDDFGVEKTEKYINMARHFGDKVKPREGKNVYRCVLSHLHPNGLEDAPLFVVVELVERLTEPNGQGLLTPDIKLSTWWTNLPESEADCVQLYRNPCTSEQLHSELYSDMGVERLPSGKFATNALVLNLAALSFNCLRIIGQNSLRLTELLPRTFNVARRRLRSVMQDLIHIACKVVSHANTKTLKFGRNCPWFNIFKKLYATC